MTFTNEKGKELIGILTNAKPFEKYDEMRIRALDYLYDNSFEGDIMGWRVKEIIKLDDFRLNSLFANSLLSFIQELGSEEGIEFFKDFMDMFDNAKLRAK